MNDDLRQKLSYLELDALVDYINDLEQKIDYLQEQIYDLQDDNED